MSSTKSDPGSSPTRPESPSLPSLPFLSPLSFPKFPKDLDERENENAAAPRRATGLFEAFVGRPDLLFQDSDKHPSKYEPVARELLSLLMSGSKALKDLVPEETALLDQATIAFFEAPKPQPIAEPPPQKKPRSKRRAESDKPHPRAASIPELELRPYWWL
jgi:hypothetical protein